MPTAVAGAGAGAGATAGVALVAGATATSVVKEIIAVVKDIGKVVIKSVVDIAKLFADPIKGLPVAVLLYLGAKQVNIDVSAVEQQIDIVVSYAKAFNFASKIDQSIKSWLSSFLRISPDTPFYELLNPITIWNAIELNLPPVIDVIAKAIIFIPVSSLIFLLGVAVGLSYLAYYVYCILLDITAIMAKVSIRFFGTAVNYLFQFVAWIVCSYIKIVQPILPLALAFRFAHKGLKKMLLSSALGTIIAYTTLYMIAPECASIAIPGVQPTPTQPPSLTAPGEELSKILQVDFETYHALTITRLLYTVLGVFSNVVQVQMLYTVIGVFSNVAQVQMLYTVIGVFPPAVPVA